MNKLFKFFMFLSIPLLSLMAVSCGDDDVDDVPEPVLVPSITGVSPTEGLPGTVITITGTNLEEVDAVQFGDIDAEGFNSANNTATTITVTVPAAAVPGAQVITVTSPDGSDTFDFTVLEEEEPAAELTIVSFDPLEGPVNTPVTITGTNFVAENIESIMLGEMELEDFEVVDAETITFTIPEGAQTGTITITPVEGDPVVSIHSFTVTEVDPTASIVTHADVVVNAQGVRNDEGMVTAFSAEGETFTLQDGTDPAISMMIDFIATDSGGDNGLDLFSPSDEGWLEGNYFEDSDDLPVVWETRNLTKMVHLEDQGADFFENITVEELAALSIGSEYETRIEIQPNEDGTPNVPQVILFETAEGQKGLVLYKGHNPNAEEGTKTDIFTFDIKVLETTE